MVIKVQVYYTEDLRQPHHPFHGIHTLLIRIVKFCCTLETEKIFFSVTTCVHHTTETEPERFQQHFQCLDRFCSLTSYGHCHISFSKPLVLNIFYATYKHLLTCQQCNSSLAGSALPHYCSTQALQACNAEVSGHGTDKNTAELQRKWNYTKHLLAFDTHWRQNL